MIAGAAVSTINRELATLRRVLRLANKWGDLTASPVEITLLDGEAVRERVLTADEESAYLNAAKPRLRAVATVIIDCGLRPDEVYRLRWTENYREGRIIIHKERLKRPAEVFQ